MLENLASAILEHLRGYPGIFLLSLVSNSIPFVGVPYLAVVIALGAIYRDPYQKLGLILSSALGAALGKIVIYFIGSGFRLKLSRRSRENLELFLKLARKSLFLATVIFASTPLPDDILYVPLGLMKYPLHLYAIAVFLGKALLTSAVVLYASGLAWLLEGDLIITVPAFIIITFVFSYFIIKVDWGRVIEVTYERGLPGAIEEVSRQVEAIVKKGFSRFGGKGN